ncbi:MAG: helix-turn-helix domain-containing protein [Phyllobacteriaceae bacterium]|nr:helix-turn-helix domain-containing protein [Phyllobacteriaceae bacterium]
MNHRADVRRVKIHRTYTVQELARITGMHDHTVRAWIKAGLATLEDARPILVSGAEAKRFLTARSKARKRPCGPGRFYCFRCREPREPALDMADYVPVTETTGDLSALCPACGTIMHKRVSKVGLGLAAARMDIAFPQASSRLDESPAPSLNRDFGKD